MIRRIVNLPFRVMGRAARAFQDRQDAAMKAAHGEGDMGDDFESLENVPDLDTPDDYHTGPTALPVHEVAAQSGTLQLIDVRTPTAHAAQSIPGAMNLPLATLGIRLAELPPATVRVVVFDDTGAESAADAARFLRWRGVEDAWHLEGGLAAWLDAHNPADD